MPSVECKVAGTSFRDTADTKYLLKLAEQTRYPAVTLEREPDNAHDPNAVRVYFGKRPKRWIGFVPREIAAKVAEYMDAGVEVTARVVTVEVWAEHPTSPSVKIEITRP